MDNPKPLHIACAFDERMVLPAVALMKSIATYHPTTPVHIHAMHSDNLDSEIAQIRADLEGPLFHLHFYTAENDFGHLNASSHYSRANFYRIELLSRMRDVDRCIYLDCDIIIRKNLESLRDMDLGSAPVAASTDYLLKYWMTELKRKIPFRGKMYPTANYVLDVLKLKSGKYFNSGVMVIDVPRWQAERISEDSMKYCVDNPGLTMVDQDGLNVILDGRYAEIDCRYNSTVYMSTLYKKSGKTPSADWKTIIDLWNDDPWIVHFTFQSKPWEPAHYETTYDKDFWDYLFQTSFATRFLRTYREKVKTFFWIKRFWLKPIPEPYRSME